MRELLGFSLGDLPVLAVKASEVTASSGYGEYLRGRIEMAEWFFLYWVNMNRAGVAIGKGVELSPDIHL